MAKTCDHQWLPKHAIRHDFGQIAKCRRCGEERWASFEMIEAWNRDPVIREARRRAIAEQGKDLWRSTERSRS